jgi:hypothetical protein
VGAFDVTAAHRGQFTLADPTTEWGRRNVGAIHDPAKPRIVSAGVSGVFGISYDAHYRGAETGRSGERTLAQVTIGSPGST